MTSAPKDAASTEHRYCDAGEFVLRLLRLLSAVLHVARLTFAGECAPLAIDFLENQELLGRLCESARVHVNWSVDRTSPDRVREPSAITARRFESAASGAAVIGSAPEGEEFMQLFPYDGFVRNVRESTPTALEAVLDAAPADTNLDDRLALAEHVRRVHTWDVRWRQIAEISGV